MDVYMYQAALLCVSCGQAAERASMLPDYADLDDENTWNSDDFPKGPYPDGGGEADSPQHCGRCGAFLENPLTAEGIAYVADAIMQATRDTWPCSVWEPFYRDALS